MQSVIRTSIIVGFYLFLMTFGFTLAVGTFNYGSDPVLPNWSWIFLAGAVGMMVASAIGFTMVIVEYLKLRKSGLHMVAMDYETATYMLDDLKARDLLKYFVPSK